jgi:hypothetical protein
MPQGKPRDPRKEQHWRQLIERWRHSGLTVRAFCQLPLPAEPVGSGVRSLRLGVASRWLRWADVCAEPTFPQPLPCQGR